MAKKTALWKAALKARNNTYSPYSKFPVGAALRVGRHVFTGCNVENSSFPAGVCAEATAIVKAVSEGKLKRGKLDEMCVVTKLGATPCGLCLQRMAEFCRPDTKVSIASLKGVLREYRFSELNPHAFYPEDLR